MEIKDLQRANHYRGVLLTNPEARAAFIENPAGELNKHAGIVLNDEQSSRVSQYIENSTALRTVFKLPMGNGPYDPGPDMDPQERKAPRWLHWLLDVIWDYFTE